MDDSVFDFFEDDIQIIQKEIKRNVVRSVSHTEGCDYGFEYESVESSNSSRTVTSVTTTSSGEVIDDVMPDSTDTEGSRSSNSENNSQHSMDQNQIELESRHGARAASRPTTEKTTNVKQPMYKAINVDDFGHPKDNQPLSWKEQKAQQPLSKAANITEEPHTRQPPYKAINVRDEPKGQPIHKAVNVTDEPTVWQPKEKPHSQKPIGLNKAANIEVKVKQPVCKATNMKHESKSSYEPHKRHEESPIKGSAKRFENRFKPVDQKERTASSENSEPLSTDRTIYSDDIETVPSRPVSHPTPDSRDLFNANSKNTRRQIKHGRRSGQEGGKWDQIDQEKRGNQLERFRRDIRYNIENGNIPQNRSIEKDKVGKICLNEDRIRKRVSGVPIKLKSEAFYENGELAVSITDDRHKCLPESLVLKLTIIHKYSESNKRTQMKPKSKPKPKNQNKSKTVSDRNIVENRANWPEFNTTLNEEANERYMKRLGI